jgi:glutathione S-transferase
MAQITLNYTPGSCNLVPHAIMRHFDINFELNRIGDPPTDVMDTTLSSEDYNLEVQKRLRDICDPQPLLIVGNRRLRAMPAILTYLAVQGDEEQLLLGRNAVEKAAVAHHLFHLAARVHFIAFRMLAAPETFIEGEAGSHKAIQLRGRNLLHQIFVEINTALTNKTFAIGRLTAVDFNLYVFARWYKELWPLRNFDTRYPEYCRVMKSVEALNGVQEAVQEEGLRLLFQN